MRVSSVVILRLEGIQGNGSSVFKPSERQAIVRFLCRVFSNTA